MKEEEIEEYARIREVLFLKNVLRNAIVLKSDLGIFDVAEYLERLYYRMIADREILSDEDNEKVDKMAEESLKLSFTAEEEGEK